MGKNNLLMRLIRARHGVYFPSKYPEGYWEAQALLLAQDVWLDAPDGTRIHAWSIPGGDNRLVTLYFHGNGGNITHRYWQFLEIVATGSSILALDYRGYGRSTGAPTERGLYQDAQTAYDHLISAGCQPSQIVLHGESMGTAVAVDLASRQPCAAVVLEAPFTSAQDLARIVAPVIGPLIVRGFNSRAKIGRVNAPIFIIHGDRDQTIPLRLGQALFAAAPEPKSFWVVPAAGHNDLINVAGADYRRRLLSFYQSLRSPQ